MEHEEEAQNMEESLAALNQRVSNASTIGSDLSEDDQVKCKPHNPFPSIKAYSEFLIEIPPEQEKHYKDLPGKLKILLDSLESELTPINVREEKSIRACSVNLSSITFSRLCKRRSTAEFNA